VPAGPSVEPLLTRPLYERNTWFRFLRDFVPSSTGALLSTSIHLIERSPRAMHKTVGGTTAVTAALTITTVVCSKHATTINDTNYTANENKLHCSKITKRINSKPSVVQISMLSSLNYGAVSKKTRTAMFRTLRRSMQALRYHGDPGLVCAASGVNDPLNSSCVLENCG